MVKVCNFFAFFILLLHLGCFFSGSRRQRRHSVSSPAAAFAKFKKKIIPRERRAITSFLRRLFSPGAATDDPEFDPRSIPSPSSSSRSLRLNPAVEETNFSQDNPLVLAPNDIHPCPVCGEVFQSSSLLARHSSVKHPISELVDGENIVRIIFKTGWPEKAKSPRIHRILKIHSSSKILSQFEEYREFVKSKAASKARASRDERCIADGNELLRFHCTTFLCDLDSAICNHQYCSTCAIIRAGFPSKMDGISTFPTGWTAHAAVPEDIEEEFKFLHVKRALLVCRVISGRVRCDPGLHDNEDPGFDSLIGRGSGGYEEELLIFNPTAVLPCFVIVYSV